MYMINSQFNNHPNVISKAIGEIDFPVVSIVKLYFLLLKPLKIFPSNSISTT